MFDVAALDNLVCRPHHRLDHTYSDQNPSPSLPSSPRSLSPVPKSRRHREPETSASPLSNPSHSASPQPSKSAQLINSSYFGPPFTLPYFRLGEENWKPALDDDGRRRRSRSIASTSTRAEADREIRLNEVEVEMSPDDEADWHTKIYEEDERATKGMDHEAEEKIFSTGIEGQLAVIAEAEERERITAKPRRRPGRPSKASKDKEDTSELSDAAAEEEEEEEEEAPKPGRTKRPNAGKRKRNSNAKGESEEEEEVKETVSE